MSGGDGSGTSTVRIDGSLTDEQRDLVVKLSSISELVEQHRASIAMLELQRMNLQTQLRQSGWRPPRPCGGES